MVTMLHAHCWQVWMWPRNRPRSELAILATWKSSLGLEFETASIHQTLQLTCRYLSTILTSRKYFFEILLIRFPPDYDRDRSVFLDRLSTPTWVLITVFCMMACYATGIIVKWTSKFIWRDSDLQCYHFYLHTVHEVMNSKMHII